MCNFSCGQHPDSFVCRTEATSAFPMKYFLSGLFMRRLGRSWLEFWMTGTTACVCMRRLHFQFEKECFRPRFCVSRFRIRRGGIFADVRGRRVLGMLHNQGGNVMCSVISYVFTRKSGKSSKFYGCLYDKTKFGYWLV